jgi:D-xylose transport system permease protein
MRAFLDRSGLDPRFTSMLLALLVMWLVLAGLTDGIFLTPRNLYNLSIQTCVIAIMACGMVYLMVARQIDLSVGSLLALTGMFAAYTQVHLFAPGSPWGWVVSIFVAIGAGVLVGIFQGWWVAYQRVPAFVVTLAGYLMYRGGAFMVAEGQTIAPLHPIYQMLGGGINGSIGVLGSACFGVLACAYVLWHRWAVRRDMRRYSAQLPPLWLEAVKVGFQCAAIVGFVAVMNSYPDATQTDAEGNPVGKGIAIPVLILLLVVFLLTFLAQRTRFGRYVFAYGGNPEAALLSGINVRRVLMKIFIMMGVLAAVAGVITTARLNSGANSIGQLAELYVIAATVIGGTSMAGGVGSIPGAVVGAIIIQTLDNGMVLLDVSSAKRQVFIGLVLIAAVWFDAFYNRKEGR